jgi:hypothetical protein
LEVHRAAGFWKVRICEGRNEVLSLVASLSLIFLTSLAAHHRFDSWEAFFWNDTTMAAELNETATVPCMQGIAKLHYDSVTTLYTPVRIHASDESLEIPKFHDFDYSTVDEEEETDDYPSVNVALLSSTGSIYGGGEFAKFNNLFKMTFDTFSPLFTPSSEAFSPGDKFYDCNQRAANATNRRGQNTSFGADFCCRSGSYCPDGAADISCPVGWGYLCEYDSEPEICPEKFYCENPGEAGEKLLV